jgi:hypothetical protein
MSRWFRFYDDAVNDPKVQRLAPDLFKVWVNLLCIVSKAGGTLPTIAEIAFTLRAKVPKVQIYITELALAGLLDKNEDGTFSPHNWNARQFKSEEKSAPTKDSYVYFIGRNWGSTLKIGFSKNPWARVGELQTAQPDKIEVLAVFKCRSTSEIDLHDVLREFRKSGEWFDLPTHIYVAVHNAADRKCTYDDLVVELRVLLRSTTTDTEQITEADTEQSRKKTPRADALEDDWPKDFGDEFWKAYPRKTEKLAAMKRLSNVRKSRIVTFTDLMAGVNRYAIAVANSDPQYTKHPTTWLNAGCWADETQPGGRNGARDFDQKRGSSSSDFFAGMRGLAADIARDGQPSGPAAEEVPLGRVNIEH